MKNEKPPLMPDRIRNTVATIKENNNLEGLSQKDIILYLAHQVEKMFDEMQKIHGCINSTDLQVTKNTEKIKWLDRIMCGIIVGIVGFFITILYFFMGV